MIRPFRFPDLPIGLNRFGYGCLYTFRRIVEIKLLPVTSIFANSTAKHNATKGVYPVLAPCALTKEFV